MRRAVAGAILVLLLGCRSASGDDPPSGEAAPSAPNGSSAPAVIRSSVSTGPAAGPAASNGDVDQVPSAGSTVVCSDGSPVVPARVGTVNTIVVPRNVDAFDGEVTPAPDEACPGDTVSFDVSIVNVSDRAQVFSAGRGLIFSSGGMAKWSLAALDDLTVEVRPGDRLEQTVSGTIPPVAAGTYRVGPEGARFFGEITVLDPTGGG